MSEYKPIRDMKLAVTLMARGHHVLDFAIEGKTVYFHFLADETASDERKFYMRELEPIPTEDILSALQRFRLLLNRVEDSFLLVSSRECVIALLAAGFKTEGLQPLEKMLYFKFIWEPVIKEYLLDLVNNAGLKISVDDFWREYQYFSDALRSR